MKKIFSLVFFILFTVSSFAIKVENNQIIDDYGNKIEAKEYKKIIVTDPGVIEILFKIGGEKSIVAIGKTSRSKIYPYDKVDKLVSIGNISNLNLEKVVEYKPDLIVVSSMMLRNVDAVKKMGYNIIVSNASSLDGILDTISVTGVISGKKEEAEKLRKECLIKLERIEKENSKKTSKLKGAILFSTSPMIAFSEDSIPGDVLKHLGVINIAANVPGQRPILSPEYILKENPDKVSEGDKKNIEAAIEELKKVKDGDDKSAIDTAMEKLSQASHKFAEELYKEAQAQAQAQQQAGAGANAGSDKKDEDVAEAEVVD